MDGVELALKGFHDIFGDNRVMEAQFLTFYFL